MHCELCTKGKSIHEDFMHYLSSSIDPFRLAIAVHLQISLNKRRPLACAHSSLVLHIMMHTLGVPLHLQYIVQD